MRAANCRDLSHPMKSEARKSAPFLVALALAMAIAGNPAAAAEADYDRVSFASAASPNTPITGLLFRPADTRPSGAIVGIHGCNGLFEADGAAVAHYVAWGRLLRDAG